MWIKTNVEIETKIFKKVVIINAFLHEESVVKKMESSSIHHTKVKYNKEESFLIFLYSHLKKHPKQDFDF
jgi:hypothetical protein